MKAKIIFICLVSLILVKCGKEYDFRLTTDQKLYLLYKENDIVKLKDSIDKDSIAVIAQKYSDSYQTFDYTEKFGTRSEELMKIYLSNKIDTNYYLGFCQVNTSYGNAIATYDIICNGTEYFFQYDFGPDNATQKSIAQITLNSISYSNILELMDNKNKGILYFSKDLGFIQLITNNNRLYNKYK
jgi:hypothetical protein